MKKCKGQISSIETSGMVDGPGIRVVIFMQGCTLRCLYCHNPETWGAKGKFEMTPEEVLEKVKRYRNYFGKTGGVTFSGGEPFYQKEFLLETLKLCKKEGIHTALDTAGIADYPEEILSYTDLVILDIKAYDPKMYTYITRGKIDTFLHFLEVCQKMNKKLWLRSVIVPGINDTEAYILGLKEFIRHIKNVEKVELLPYQTLGVHKYKALGIAYPLLHVEAMNQEKCKKLNALLNEGLYE